MLHRLHLALLLAGCAHAQVLLVDGDAAFVVAPGATVELSVRLSGASLGGGLAGINVRFIAPIGRGTFGTTTSVTVVSDATGKATAKFTCGPAPGWFSVDAVAELGDGAVASFAFSSGLGAVRGDPSAIRNSVRQSWLRNAADGSTLQLMGPYWLPAGTTVKSARWSEDKEGGGPWKAAEGTWLLWVDDGPAKAWPKANRYYFVPGTDVARARVAGEAWWPLAQSPDGLWQSLGRATSTTGELLGFGSSGTPAGNDCAIIMANSGSAGSQLSAEAFQSYVRKLGVQRTYTDPALANSCAKAYILLSGLGDADGILLDRWRRYEDLGESLKRFSDMVVVVEANQSAAAAAWWQGLGFSAQVITSTDELRLGYMQPLRGGYVVRALIPALEKNGGDWEKAVQETTRGEVVVASPRPQFIRVLASAVRKIQVPSISFSNIGGSHYFVLPRTFAASAIMLADPRIATLTTNGAGFLVRTLAEGATDFTIAASDASASYVARGSIRVGLGASTVKTCLLSVAAAPCVGVVQRNIPVAEDEVGGHVFFSIRDESIAAIDAAQYTYNRGERNIPFSVRGLKAGTTSLRVRSHDGRVLLDVPIEVRDLPQPIPGLTPRSCPDNATFRTTFTVSGGDTSLYDPIGGAWWGDGITLIFRRTGDGLVEVRSSGASDGQFFAMSGRIEADCSFNATGIGIAALRITTAQVRGKISATAGVFDTLDLDYSIGGDGLLLNGKPIQYKGTGRLSAACDFSLVAPSTPISPYGGFFTIGMRTPALCPWTSTSAANWAPILVGDIGFGPGLIWLRAAENTGPARKLTLLAGGKSIELNQEGIPANAPVIQAAFNAGSLNATMGPAQIALILGQNLGNEFLLQGKLAANLLSFSDFALVSVPAAPQGAVDWIARRQGIDSRPYTMVNTAAAPGIFTAAGQDILATGIDITQPLTVEVDGVEANIQSLTLVNPGVIRLQLQVPAPSGGKVLIRQGGLSSTAAVVI